MHPLLWRFSQGGVNVRTLWILIILMYHCTSHRKVSIRISNSGAIVETVASYSLHSDLRSSTSNTYVTPRLHTKFGKRAFSHAGPTAWNSLPVNIRAETSKVKFKNLLKTHLFNLAFSSWLRVLFSWFVVYTILCLIMRLCSFSNERTRYVLM